MALEPHSRSTVLCVDDFTSQAHADRYSAIIQRSNAGIQQRDRRRVEAASQIFAECVSSLKNEVGPESPFVAPVLKSMMILQFDFVGGTSGYEASIELAKRAASCLVNGLMCDRVTSREKQDLAEQCAMICDYKVQAETKLKRFGDACGSAKMAIENMELAGLTNHPKYLELKMASQLNMMALAATGQGRRSKANSNQRTTVTTAAALQMDIKVLPCVVVMCQTVSRWQNVDTKMHGVIGTAPEQKKPTTPPPILNLSDPALSANPALTAAMAEPFKGTVTSVLLSNPQAGFKSPVRTVSDFIGGSTNLDDACGWYARMKLRYSCSSITVAFVRFIVPELSRHGIALLQVDGIDQPIETRELSVCTIFFEPAHRYMVEYSMIEAALGEQTQAITQAMAEDPSFVDSMEPDLRRLWERPAVQEIVEGNLPHCTHNVLRCRKSGVIIDLTGGQFTGNMQPATYANLDSFKASLPGKVLLFRECPESEVQEQLDRDESTAKRYKPYHPKQWAPQVVTDSIAGQADGKFWETLCRGCLGTPTSFRSCNMKRCGRCKRVLYCCRECQAHDWKRHRSECVSVN